MKIEQKQLPAIPPKDEAALSEYCDKRRERWDELHLKTPGIARKYQAISKTKIETSTTSNADSPTASE